MTWLRMSDNFASDPVLLNVCRTRSDITRVLGWVTELMLYSASHLTDGYVPELIYRDVVRSRRWRDLLVSPPGGGTALLHRRGDTCECLKDRPLWPDTAADLYIHHYLQSNPSREETDVARAKQAELRDRELQASVRHRDQGSCRYCGIKVRWADRRSSHGGVFDHVDPTIAAGAANLVVACRGCNSRKGNRTPDAAGMTLLPVPGSTTTTAPSDADRMVDGRFDQAPTNRLVADTTTHAPVRDGTGRANDPGQLGPPSTRRTSRHPNPYTKSGMTGVNPLDNAGLPDPAAIDAADREIPFEQEINDDTDP